MKNPFLLPLLFSIFILNQLSAQNGALDPSFSSDGKLTLAYGSANDGAYALAVQSDGKIIVGGFTVANGKTNFALARYNANGTLDNSFDSDGKVSTVFGNGNNIITGLAIQPDGKIIVVGNAGLANLSGSMVAVLRYNSDGSLDTGFDGDGIVTTSYGGGFESAAALALQADGKIVVVGSLKNGTKTEFGVIRYLTNGSLDNSFSSDGIITTNFGTNYNDAYAVAIQPDGKIVAAGRAFDGAQFNFALARYIPQGVLDDSFLSGRVVTNIDNKGGLARAVAIQPDGKIVAAGYVESGGDHDFALARYNPDGFPDNSFGGDGSFVTALTSGDEEITSMILQPDGKIVVAGNTFTGPQATNSDFALIRYLSNGTRDNSFGANGLVTTSFSNIEDIVHALALQPDGKIVAAGSTDDNQTDFALARYLSGLAVGVLDFSVLNNAVFIYPNPVTTGATLQYSLEKPADMTIQLFDIQGNIISTLMSAEKQEAGDHQVDLKFPELLPAGNYVLVLSNESGRVSIKIVK
jgi:uncharacterized delta-60 repeat protein